MATSWVVCKTCGGVVADQELHEQWHSHGEQVDDGERAEASDAG